MDKNFYNASEIVNITGSGATGGATVTFKIFDFEGNMISELNINAKANGEFDQAAFGNQIVDAPLQEFTMPFDRPHDLRVQLYSSKLPFGINASLVGFYQSGFPYTGTYEKGDGEPVSDVLNKYSKRSPAFKQIDISFSKYIEMKDCLLYTYPSPREVEESSMTSYA